MKAFSPPDFPTITGKKSLFLGGSIEMGKARNWQQEVIDLFDLPYPRDLIILNPRRKDWDSTWEQDIKSPQFYQQVQWELTYLEQCTHRIFYFAQNTISPITLMELGKFGHLPNTYVCVQTGYEKEGNVDIFCHRYNIPMLYSLAQLKTIL